MKWATGSISASPSGEDDDQVWIGDTTRCEMKNEWSVARAHAGPCFVVHYRGYEVSMSNDGQCVIFKGPTWSDVVYTSDRFNLDGLADCRKWIKKKEEVSCSV